jgi:methionine sulfoxide reductase heme-binding subunit
VTKEHKSNGKTVKNHVRSSTTFLLCVSIVALVMAESGIQILSRNTWVSGESFWLVSRASALIAYIVLTVIVVLGILISHPLNKSKWRLGKILLPWHQTLLPVFFSLLIVHVLLTVLDHKSGVTWGDLPLPIHAAYHPIAMTFGTMSLYLLILVTVTTGLRRFFRIWLPIHRIAWVTWLLTSIHGFFGGSDARQFIILYIFSALFVIGAFYWRHWTRDTRVNSSVKTIKKSSI